MAIYVIGPQMPWVEPGAVPAAAPAPVPEGRVGIAFAAQSPVVAGGTVNVTLLPPVNPSDLVPIQIFVLYIPSTTPIPPNAPVSWYWALTGEPKAAFSMPAPPPAAGTPIPITVSPVPTEQPYTIATILAYAS